MWHARGQRRADLLVSMLLLDIQVRLLTLLRDIPSVNLDSIHALALRLVHRHCPDHQLGLSGCDSPCQDQRQLPTFSEQGLVGVFHARRQYWDPDSLWCGDASVLVWREPDHWALDFREGQRSADRSDTMSTGFGLRQHVDHTACHQLRPASDIPQDPLARPTSGQFCLLAAVGNVEIDSP
jgi:hypothetical protein